MNNTTQELQLSNITTFFVPIIFLVLMIGLVFNTLLLVLIWKTRKVNNNTNVYLFSLAIIGLMRIFPAFNLMVTLVARNWVLGKEICFINQFLMRLITGITTPTILAMSYDRYITMKHPFRYYRKSRKRTFTIVSLIWIVFSIAGSPAAFLTISEIARAPRTIWTECFSSTMLMGGVKEVRETLVALNVAFLIVMAFAIAITLIYFIALAKELRAMKKTHNGCILPASSPLASIDTVSIRYKPNSIEKQTTRTFSSIIFFQSTCTVISTMLFVTAIVIHLLSQQGSQTIVFQHVYTLMLFFFILPYINPFIVMLNNSKFRNRVKKLLSGSNLMSLYKNRSKKQNNATKPINTSRVTVHQISRNSSIFITRSAPVPKTQPAIISNMYTELGFLPGQIYE